MLPVKSIKGITYNDSFLKIKDVFYKNNLRICKEYCEKQILNLEVPKYSKLNNMFLETPPEEISGLNSYELLLIQLAKCLMTIIQLKTCQNSNQTLTKAIKGQFNFRISIIST
jgi:NifB/MoaA-like Fe-S oxidoreductase